MRKYVVLGTLWISFLAGCSHTEDQRGFSYHTPMGTFICAQKPAKTELKLPQELDDVLKAIAALQMGVRPNILPDSEDDEALRTAITELTGAIKAAQFPNPKELVTYCQNLLNGNEINYPEEAGPGASITQPR